MESMSQHLTLGTVIEAPVSFASKTQANAPTYQANRTQFLAIVGALAGVPLADAMKTGAKLITGLGEVTSPSLSSETTAELLRELATLTAAINSLPEPQTGRPKRPSQPAQCSTPAQPRVNPFHQKAVSSAHGALPAGSLPDAAIAHWSTFFSEALRLRHLAETREAEPQVTDNGGIDGDTAEQPLLR